MSQIQMTSVIDLTECKKAEEELRESEGCYRAVVEQAAEGILLFDVDSKRVSEANVACQNLLGYTPEAILRLTLYDLGPSSLSLSAEELATTSFDIILAGHTSKLLPRIFGVVSSRRLRGPLSPQVARALRRGQNRKT